MCAALGDVSDAAAAAGPRLNGKPEDKINGLFGSDPLVTFCGWHVQAKKKILMQRRTYRGDFLGHYFCVSLSLFIIIFFFSRIISFLLCCIIAPISPLDFLVSSSKENNTVRISESTGLKLEKAATRVELQLCFLIGKTTCSN